MTSKLPEVKEVLSYDKLEKLVLGYKNFKGVSVKPYELKSGRKIYHLTYGKGNKKLVSVCALHGNERSAAQFWYKSLNEVIKKGMPKDIKYSVVAPANPDGLAADDRLNDFYVDLNRDWDDFSQLETRIIKSIIDTESKNCQTIVFDHHEASDQPLYFLEDPGSAKMEKIRNIFFEELYKELKKHDLPMMEWEFFHAYTNRHIAQAARSGQLINYTAQKNMFSLIVENMGQDMGKKLLGKRMQAHASVDLAGLRTLSKLKAP